MPIRAIGIAIDAVDLIAWALVKCVLRRTHTEIRFGALRIFGDHEFHAACLQALDKLEALDESMYANIRQANIVLVGPINGKPSYRQINRRFGIHRWMLETGSDAVIFGMVVSYFVNKEFQMRGRGKSRLLLRQPREAFARASEWLRRNGLDEEYINMLEVQLIP